MGRQSPYSEEFRRDAVALYRAAGGRRTYPQVAAELGVTAESLRTWVRKADGEGPAVAVDRGMGELARLRAENARLLNTNTIRYNSDKGLWQERTLRFDSALLKQGENEIQLTVPAGDLQSGVVWDYLRLELAGND